MHEQVTFAWVNKVTIVLLQATEILVLDNTKVFWQYHNIEIIYHIEVSYRVIIISISYSTLRRDMTEIYKLLPRARSTRGKAHHTLTKHVITDTPNS